MKILKLILGSGALLMALGKACIKNADHIRYLPINQTDNVYRYIDEIPGPKPASIYELPTASNRPKFNRSNSYSSEKILELKELASRKTIQDSTTFE